MHPQYTCRYCGVLFVPHSPYNAKGCAHRRLVEPTTATCRQCGREFSRVLESSDGGTHCSRRCAAKTANQASLAVPKATAVLDERECVRCGGRFTLIKASSRKRYCSHRCYLGRTGKAHAGWKPKITLTCEGCQCQFQTHPFQEERRRYCSRACKHQAQRHNLDTHVRRTHVRYAEWRSAVLDRDAWACQHCGQSAGIKLHAHHIAPWASNPDLRFEVSNGLTLCWPCHTQEHRRLRRLANLLKPARQLTMHL
jgi:hypothetical protein